MTFPTFIINFRNSVILFIFYILTFTQCFAESLFSTALTVNNLVITNYDLNQRELLYKFLKKTGNIKTVSRKDLINDRIKQHAINNEKISLTEIELKDNFVNFGKNIGLDELRLSNALNNSGIDHETLIAYLSVQKGWQKLVIKKFIPLIDITPHEVERFYLYGDTFVDTKILLAEIALPLSKNTSEQSRKVIKQIRKKAFTVNEFSKLASTISISPTAKNGGLLEWLPLNSLPKGLRVKLLNLKTGELSSPIVMGASLLVFQMRGIRYPKKENSTILSLREGNTYNIIKNKLFDQKAQFYANSFFGKLKANAVIVNR
jgi:peptidyl-prolyl cis-trans isomerase SurA